MATPSTATELNPKSRSGGSRLFFASSAAIRKRYPDPVQTPQWLRVEPSLTLSLFPAALAIVASRTSNGQWYWRKLRMDKDGDIADEFFDDISFTGASPSRACPNFFGPEPCPKLL